MYEGLLEEYSVQCEIVSKNSDILMRVNRILEELEIEPLILPEKPSIPYKSTLKEILGDIEQKLVEVEARSKPFTETISLANTLTRKIDHKLHTWNMRFKIKVNKNNIDFYGKSPKEMLLEVERQLAEIDAQMEKIAATSTRCARIISRIEQLTNNLKVATKHLSTQKISVQIDELFLSFIEMKL
ncbi:MAG: hypothetical protein QXX08_11480, partial [Candidatus Bathyarchaeia archaeon]